MWEGLEVSGKYRVERVLGEGGMGVVLLARHLELGHPVAIKCLRRELADHAEARGRFEREARAAAALTSEHVAHVTDVGRMPDGTPFMVMEYLEGEDLACHLERGGPLAAPFAVECMLQACEALAEAHQKGIIHRDIKPSNLFLVRRPGGRTSLKVLDFGIAKAASAGGAELTRTSAIVGSPLYMSPEQLRESKDVDSRSDVWSLGVTLFHILTKRHPFEADAVGEIYGKILYTEPLRLRACERALPEELESVIADCLAKDPAQRIDSVASLAARLDSFRIPAPISQDFSAVSSRKLEDAPAAHTAPRERSGGTTLAMTTHVPGEPTTLDAEAPVEAREMPEDAEVPPSRAPLGPPQSAPTGRARWLLGGLAAAGAVVALLASGRGSNALRVEIPASSGPNAPSAPPTAEALTTPPTTSTATPRTGAQEPAAPVPARPAAAPLRPGTKAAAGGEARAFDAGPPRIVPAEPVTSKPESEVLRSAGVPPPTEKRKRSSVLEMPLE